MKKPSSKQSFGVCSLTAAVMSLLLVLGVCQAFVPTSDLISINRLKNQPSVVVQTQQLFLSASDEDDEIDDSSSSSSSSDDFMASLRNRMAEVENRDTKMPLVVLDSMLPRQVLKLQVNNPLFLELIKDRIEKETRTFGMVGMARLVSGQSVHLRHGVEVTIVDQPQIVAISNDGEASSGDKDDQNNGNVGMQLELQAGRRFVIEGEVENAGKGWTEARVKFLDSSIQEEEEVDSSDSDSDRMAVARAIMNARELHEIPIRQNEKLKHNITLPTASATSAEDGETTVEVDIDNDSITLIDRWIQLAKQNERSPGQIQALVEQIGSKPPPSTSPTELAFYIGALINPIPAMGVAKEIRPSLLTSKTAEERVHIAYRGIIDSIQHMDGTKKMW